MAKPPAQVQVNLTYVDRSEIAVDSLEKSIFDGQTVRIEFVVNRIKPAVPPAPMTGEKYTACRLVMPIIGFSDFAAKVNGLLNALIQQGTIQQLQVVAETPGKPN
jgi:hypothetical protein